MAGEPARLGFAGLGWIGASRLRSLVESGAATVGALCEPDREKLAKAAAAHPEAAGFTRWEDLLSRSEALALDGVVIATPNAFHAEQCLDALGAGLAVLCQKPLTVTRADAERVLRRAREKDRLLGVDYTYRHTASAKKLRELVQDGELGEMVHLDASFHNAYGPDKAWCFDVGLSGGGALIDLGVHLIDLVLWIWEREKPAFLSADLHRGGARLSRGGSEPEDFAELVLQMESGAKARISVSWNAHLGQDCQFRIAALGTRGGASFENADGSFYDFELWLLRGRQRSRWVREGAESLARATIDWSRALARRPCFDPGVESTLAIAEILDRAYGR